MVNYLSQCKISTSTTTLPLDSLEVDSFIRGYHAYKEQWTPTTGEQLVLRREPENPEDPSAVAVIKDEEIVGHIPFNISSTVSQFLRRAYNTGFAEVTGPYVNRGAGYGLEVPCIYGPEPYIGKLQELLKSLKDKGLV